MQCRTMTATICSETRWHASRLDKLRFDELPSRAIAAGRIVNRTTIALLALTSIATPVAAFHRQTPPIVPITIGGDTPLSRLPAGYERLVCAIGSSGPQI